MNTLNIKKLKNVWPDLLPENLLLGSVIDRNSIWSSSGWKEQRKYLNISVGLSDFPAMQIQESLAIDFEEAAHLAVVGGPGGGKTTFLNTLITSAALSYSPENLNFYILDFGTRTLGMFTKLPHVGGVVMSDEDVKT